MEDTVDDEVARLRPRKKLLQQGLEEAVSSSAPLLGCRIEVVGSTSWGGEVPQSDLDVVLITPLENRESCDAVALLEELRIVLESRKEALNLKRIRVVADSRVPILTLSDAQGLSCDVSVNQFRCQDHREFLKEALKGRPQVLSMIRLVKFWLRRRGLPMAAEGGLPSLAWAVLALHLAGEQPAGTSVEVLLLHFFSQLQPLAEQSLAVSQNEKGEPLFEWQPRSATPFAEEWVQLFTLEDPTVSQKRQGGVAARDDKQIICVTPPSIPAALCALYIAELRSAWRAVREGSWDELWRSTPPEVRMPLPSYLNVAGNKAPLQILLKDGVVQLAQLLEVRKCPVVAQSEDPALHRRDQSSELVLQPCGLEKASKGGTPSIKILDVPTIACQPCHWVCALPTWNKRLLPGDGLYRLGDISLMVEVARIGPGISLWDVAYPGQRPVVHGNGRGAYPQNQSPVVYQAPVCPPGGIAWVPWPVAAVGAGLVPRPQPMQLAAQLPLPSAAQAGQNWRQSQSSWHHQNPAGQGHLRSNARQAPKAPRAPPAVASSTASSEASSGKPAVRARANDDPLRPASSASQPAEHVNDDPLRPPGAHSDESTRASDSDGGDSQKTDGGSKLASSTDIQATDGKSQASRLEAHEESAADGNSITEEAEESLVAALPLTPGLIKPMQSPPPLPTILSGDGVEEVKPATEQEDGITQSVNMTADYNWSLVLALNIDAPHWCRPDQL